MNIIKNIWEGNYSLIKMFWLIWFIPNFILSTFISKLTVKFHIIHICFQLFFLIYYVFTSIGVWKSANQYEGRKLWTVTAKISVFSIIIIPVFILSLYLKPFTPNPYKGYNSYNIEKILHSDPNYPFIGFWKMHPEHKWGLAINKVGDGKYSVSFCGPGGCFKPGTYRSNTRIVDDSKYQIIDENTIKVKGRKGFGVYHRFINNKNH